MISVSNAWKKTHTQFLLPETFLEISCGFTDVGIQDVAEPVSSSEAIFSNTESVVGSTSSPTVTNYATLEHNLWVLDGSMDLIPDSEPYTTPGYVSATDTGAGVTIRFPEPRTVPIPGLIITWSNEHGEYPTTFNVEAKNGSTVVANLTVTGNNSAVSEVDLELANYDSLSVTPLDWSTPDRRCRIDVISFGHVVTFSKGDVLSYTHEQHGDLNSAELPKNSIEFTLDNTDGRWNPSNPTGIGKYLSERQEVTVRYGMDENGVIEWIPGGKFYLSEWRTPANGLEAYFVARDVFEYMLNEPYTGATSGTLTELITEALGSVSLPEGFEANVAPVWGDIPTTLPAEKTVAEVIQMCANAGECVLWQDRAGVLNIRPLNKTYTDYLIGANLSYAHPEVELSKPLKAVSVNYFTEVTNDEGDPESVTNTVVIDVGTSGETQTVNNPLVRMDGQAASIANWVKETMESRKTVTGEFRADPRLDLFDIVVIESKYGTIRPVAITNVRYSYSGSFRASYTGRVISNAACSSLLGEFVLGQGVLG